MSSSHFWNCAFRPPPCENSISLLYRVYWWDHEHVFLVVGSCMLSRLVLVTRLTATLGVDNQFTCTVGLPCILSLFDAGLPSTPAVRVSSDTCGSSSASPAFKVEGSPAESFDLGVMPSIIGGSSTLQVCVKSNTASDPNYSISFGTVSVIGPTATATADCFMGADCRVTVTGNRLSSVYGVVFFLISGNCASGQSAPTAFGLSPVQTLQSESAPQFTYRTFGIVDAGLSQDQTLTLCWSPTSTYGASTPVQIGTLGLKGPLTRSLTITCYLGTNCEFSYADAAATFILTASSSCGPNSVRVGYPGSFTGLTSYVAGKHSFGTATGPNGISGSSFSICWSRGGTDHVVKVGTLQMIGPGSSSNSFSCLTGKACSLQVAGFFGGHVGTASVRTGATCSSPVASLAPAGNPATIGPLSATATSSLIPISGLGISVPASSLLVCWTPSVGGASPVPVGQITFFGPVAPSIVPQVTIGDSFSIDLLVRYPSLQEVAAEQLALVEASAGFLVDPCRGLPNF